MPQRAPSGVPHFSPREVLGPPPPSSALLARPQRSPPPSPRGPQRGTSPPRPRPLASIQRSAPPAATPLPPPPPPPPPPSKEYECSLPLCPRCTRCRKPLWAALAITKEGICRKGPGLTACTAAQPLAICTVKAPSAAQLRVMDFPSERSDTRAGRAAAVVAARWRHPSLGPPWVTVQSPTSPPAASKGSFISAFTVITSSAQLVLPPVGDPQTALQHFQVHNASQKRQANRVCKRRGCCVVHHGTGSCRLPSPGAVPTRQHTIPVLTPLAWPKPATKSAATASTFARAKRFSA